MPQTLSPKWRTPFAFYTTWASVTWCLVFVVRIAVKLGVVSRDHNTDAQYLQQDMLHSSTARHLAHRQHAAASKSSSLLLFWDKIFNNLFVEIKSVAGKLGKSLKLLCNSFCTLIYFIHWNSTWINHELCTVPQNCVLYHKIVYWIIKLCTVPQNCVLYHKIVYCIIKLCTES